MVNKLPIDIDTGLPIDIVLLTKSKMMLILKSTILQRINDETIIISMPIYNGRLLPLEKDLRIVIVYTLKEVGHFEFEAIVMNRSVEDGLHQLTLVAMTSIVKSQRRNYYRVIFLESLDLVRLNKELPEATVNKLKNEYEKKIEKYKDRKDIIVDDPPIYFETTRIECRDISGGGIRCLTKSSLEIFELLQGTLHVEGLEVSFTGEVIRISQSNDSIYPYEIGIKFIEIDENTRTRLISYVFKKQRNLIKKD